MSGVTRTRIAAMKRQLTEDLRRCVSPTDEDIRRMIGADSLGYLRLERLEELVDGLPICKGCFNGNYPLEPPTEDIRGEYEK